MKQKHLAVFAAAILFAITSFGQSDSATMMKNWQNYMTPGAMHKMLASWSGKWNADITLYGGQPGMPPSNSKGTSESKMVLNGLYQESVHKATMMGMPFEGHETIGFDNLKKVFVASWIDNMGSGIMNMEGTWDAATKSITLTGKTIDPMSGQMVSEREVFKVIDDNNQMLEMYGQGYDGKEMKMMEIKYTRKK